MSSWSTDNPPGTYNADLTSVEVDPKTGTIKRTFLVHGDPPTTMTHIIKPPPIDDRSLISDFAIVCPSCKEQLTTTITTHEGAYDVTYCSLCNYPVRSIPIRSFRASSPHVLPKQERT